MLRRVTRKVTSSVARRNYCNKKDVAKDVKKGEEELSREQVLKMANKARADDQLWKIAAPERALTIFHPATWVLLAIILFMQVSLYNKHGGTLPDDDHFKKEIKKEGWDE
eukprot:TRINITY_DN37942_c0_g1_i1.p1 TRINITY_DN37942_c0_g1~~TRINITY_DN37942_c0_g1_i1.p1  ORF type:complete len:129 (+),score=25.91 TRINITY_DN37942_c0_g1_i1:58-387(+)